MINSSAAQNLAFALSGAGVDPADLIRRSDYQSEGEYYIALAKAAEALDNPNVRRALLRVKEQERKKEIEAARKEERERIREAAENWKLTDEEVDEIQSRAAAQAAKEFAAGDLGKNKTIASRQRELYKDMEKKARIAAAGNQAINDAIRAMWLEPSAADIEFTDRIINRPVADPDSLD